MTVGGNGALEDFTRGVADSQLSVRPDLQGWELEKGALRLILALPAFELVKYYFIKERPFWPLKNGKIEFQNKYYSFTLNT